MRLSSMIVLGGTSAGRESCDPLGVSARSRAGNETLRDKEIDQIPPAQSGWVGPGAPSLFEVQRMETVFGDRNAYSRPVFVRSGHVKDAFTTWNSTGEDFFRARPE